MIYRVCGICVVIFMHHSSASDGLSNVDNVGIVPGYQKSITIFPSPYGTLTYLERLLQERGNQNPYRMYIRTDLYNGSVQSFGHSYIVYTSVQNQCQATKCLPFYF